MVTRLAHPNSHYKKIFDLEKGWILVPKVAYETHEQAIEMAKRVNATGENEFKTVSYLCTTCHKWHIGKNKTKLDKKTIEKHKQDVIAIRRSRSLRP